MARSDKWVDAPLSSTVLQVAELALRSRIDRACELLPLAARAAGDAAADVEAVHQLRVTTRRAAAVLSTFGAVLPNPRRDKLRRRLRAVRKAADAARDLDVFLLDLRARVDVPAAFLDEVVALRRAAQAPIEQVNQRLAGGEKLSGLAERLLREAKFGPGAPGRAARVPFARWAPRKAEREFQRFLAALPDRADVGGWHQFRIAGKRVRYTIELLSSALPPAIRHTAYPLLVDLQERLGRMNDFATAQRRLQAWRRSAEPDFVERLIVEQQQLQQAARENWVEALDDGEAERLREAMLAPLALAVR